MSSLTIFVELEAIRENIAALRKIYGTRLLFMVKSNAYGHGIAEVAENTEDLVDYFGTATADEGVLLRRSGIKKPILTAVLKEREADIFTEYGLIAAVTRPSQLYALSRAAAEKRASVHIKIDSGMNRLGVKSREAFSELLTIADSLENVDVSGCYTHLFNAGDDGSLTAQRNFFAELTDDTVSERGLLRHISGGFPAILRADLRFDMVRVGLAAYGCGDVYPPFGCVGNGTHGMSDCGGADAIILRRAMSAVAEVIESKTARAGENVSYGNTRLLRDANIAVVSAGYGDGVSRRFGGGELKIRGRRCAILGVPCMDMLIVDTGDFQAFPGEPAVLLDDELNAKYWAAISDTVPYEIVCGFHNRANYIYLK
ncbi:MAG: alanine racemase [Clostridiales bacterium]|jgi:alanine racemase|nr:alanine racemase [Clostridiales bacterium]